MDDVTPWSGSWWNVLKVKLTTSSAVNDCDLILELHAIFAHAEREVLRHEFAPSCLLFRWEKEASRSVGSKF